MGDGNITKMRFPAFIGAGVAASGLAVLLGYAQKLPCSSGGAWNNFTGQFRQACYTDIYPLYYNEGLSAGQVPYSGHQVEYPVLIGAAMQLAAWTVHSVTDPFARGRDFYYVTVLLLAICLLAGVLATGYAAGQEQGGLKAELMVALSPGLILAAFINWDLLAMAVTAGGIAAWAARREVLAGVLLGLGVATKFYPLLIFAALLLLCLRAGRVREFGQALAAGVFTWLAVNLPIAILAPAGWAKFFAFSRSRGADWGSLWYMFEHFNIPVVGSTSLGELNLMSSVSFAIAFVAIVALALTAPRRPRLPQLCFLLLASFLMLNKVWSPQYVVWLVPFAVLARPRLWPYLLWQLTEVVYFFGIWGYFVYLYRSPGDGGYLGLSSGWYFAVLLARFATVGLLATVVVHDILHPERDVVRATGDRDDPAGGVLDGAPDRLVIVWQRGVPRPVEASAGLSGGLSRDVVAEPADVRGEPCVGRLADNRRARRAHHVEQDRRVDRPGVEVRVPVGARPELVARVVAVHQVDPAGDRLDPVDRLGEIDTRRVGVAGVQAEPDLAAVRSGVGHRLPQPRDGVERACHRAVAARRVLDEHGQRPLDALDRLAPVLQTLGRVYALVDVPAVHDQRLRADRRRSLELLVEQFP